MLQPRIQGHTLNMPLILIFLGVIAGGEIAGLLGVMFAVPTLAVLKVLFDFFHARLYTEYQRTKESQKSSTTQQEPDT